MKAFLFIVLVFVTLQRVSAQDFPTYMPGEAIIVLTNDANYDFSYSLNEDSHIVTTNPLLNRIFSLLQVSRMNPLHPIENYSAYEESVGMNREYVISFSSDFPTYAAIDTLLSIPSVIEYATTNAFFTTGPLIAVPRSCILYQNYPNPFNPGTTIYYGLTNTSVVTFAVYNILGDEVDRIKENIEYPGYHSVTWDATTQAGGIYYLRMTAAFTEENKVFTSIKKMVLLR